MEMVAWKINSTQIRDVYSEFSDPPKQVVAQYSDRLSPVIVWCSSI